MKLHWLQHVPFEGLGYIEKWATEHGAEISCTRLHADDILPDLDEVDLLIVMGGPMGIFDYEEHPWLADEKAFIRSAIAEGKTIIGICLGAQLMADVLGAKVYPGPQKEIGWYPIRRCDDAPTLIPEELTVFHWHGDTFETPEGAIPLAVSEPGINQGFIYKDRAIALQFHMETTEQSINDLVENCADELVDAPYIQTAERIREKSEHISPVNRAMKTLLDSLL
jgi:GMP synthase (glutamine-hydrolysing)